MSKPKIASSKVTDIAQDATIPKWGDGVTKWGDGTKWGVWEATDGDVQLNDFPTATIERDKIRHG